MKGPCAGGRSRHPFRYLWNIAQHQCKQILTEVKILVALFNNFLELADKTGEAVPAEVVWVDGRGPGTEKKVARAGLAGNVSNWRLHHGGASYSGKLSCVTNLPERKPDVRKPQKNQGFLTPVVLTALLFRGLQSPQAKTGRNRLRINHLLLRVASSGY
jgi:hypothetical protein